MGRGRATGCPAPERSGLPVRAAARDGGRRMPQRRGRMLGGAAALALAALAFAAPPPMAQNLAPGDLPGKPASLVADSMTLDRTGRRITAEGNVEVFHEGRHLTARRITYDRASNQIAIEGPITLSDGARSVVLAEQAELTRDLREGILTGARLVLDRQLQIAAGRAERIEGRYVRLENTIASSCRICNDGDVPVWRIRAREVIHDREKRRLYFRHARFEAFGVPIGYTPWLSTPDPSVERATGFLPPQFVNSGDLGTGFKLPFFITLGDHADLTLTPLVTVDNALGLFADYRQRFAAGDFDISGLVADDDRTSQDVRGFVFARGLFDVPQDFKLHFDLEAVSDEGVLLTYDVTDKDRLDSALGLRRTQRDQHMEGAFTFFHTLRDSENNSTQLTRTAATFFEQRFTPALVGGATSVSFESFGGIRTSGTDGAAGRDTLAASLAGDWQRSWIAPAGIVFTTLAGGQLDVRRIWQDSAFNDTETRALPYGGAELRWPFQRQDTGAAHVVEPVAQLVWSPDDGDTLPNEDSLAVEFDETNLFALSRFTGRDGVERGLRANLGVSYTRFDAAGWTLGLAAGRVLRDEDLGQFTRASGLAGESSDWVTSLHLGFAPGLSMTARSVFSGDVFGGEADISKGELRMRYAGERARLDSTFVWLRKDAAEFRPDDLSELALRGGYWLTPNWQTTASWRFDPVEDETTRAGFGIVYRSECVLVDLSATRRFTSSSEVSKSTSISLSVSLAGIGSRAEGGAARLNRCNG